MKRLLFVVLLGSVLAAQQGQGCPDCSDPSEPWMRGNVEKSCAPAMFLDELKRAKGEGAIVLPCACQHTCDPMNDKSEKTDRRGWDYRCEARCNPNNCNCPHPCDSD